MLAGTGFAFAKGTPISSGTIGWSHNLCSLQNKCIRIKRARPLKNKQLYAHLIFFIKPA